MPMNGQLIVPHPLKPWVGQTSNTSRSPLCTMEVYPYLPDVLYEGQMSCLRDNFEALFICDLNKLSTKNGGNRQLELLSLVVHPLYRLIKKIRR